MALTQGGMMPRPNKIIKTYYVIQLGSYFITDLNDQGFIHWTTWWEEAHRFSKLENAKGEIKKLCINNAVICEVRLTEELVI